MTDLATTGQNGTFPSPADDLSAPARRPEIIPGLIRACRIDVREVPIDRLGIARFDAR